MIYKEKFKIGLKDVWAKDEVSNIAILEYLEDIAAYHSDSVGIGINTTEETHLNWLLLDWELEVLKRPRYGQVLDIHTWSRGIEKFYAFRKRMPNFLFPGFSCFPLSLKTYHLSSSF